MLCATLAPSSPKRGRSAEAPIEQVIARPDKAQLVEVIRTATERHSDVERVVRLVAARADGDLAALHAAVDQGLRTRRFLDYRESMAWADAARPVVAELDKVAVDVPSRELVELVQRAIGHVVKVIMHADASSGLIGDVALELLRVHAKACDAGVADPVKLARWMIRFRFEDQDFFEVDPVRYSDALGERGLRAYRQAVAESASPRYFAARYAHERLAILDGDIDELVRLLGGDLSGAHQFQRVAEAMVELDRPDLALDWATRGIEKTSGWQIANLYDLACNLHVEAGTPSEALRLRRAHHERTPSGSTYGALRSAAGACDAWHLERDAARQALERADRRAFVSVLLDDGDDELAWEAASRCGSDEIDQDLLLRLANCRQLSHPAEALTVYTRVVDSILVETDRRAYRRAVQILKRPRGGARRGRDRRLRRQRRSATRGPPPPTDIHRDPRQGQAHRHLKRPVQGECRIDRSTMLSGIHRFALTTCAPRASHVRGRRFETCRAHDTRLLQIGIFRIAGPAAPLPSDPADGLIDGLNPLVEPMRLLLSTLIRLHADRSGGAPAGHATRSAPSA
jgi:hypothetical protein